MAITHEQHQAYLAKIVSGDIDQGELQSSLAEQKFTDRSPEQLQELYQAIVRKYPVLFTVISKIFYEVVKEDPYQLLNIPIEFRDSPVCQVAVKYDTFLLGEIKNYKETTALTEQDFKSICNIAVQENGEALEYVPLEMRTYELCLEAVRATHNSSSAIDFVLEAKQHLTVNQLKAIFVAAVQHNSDAISKIAVRYWNYDLCFAMVQAKGANLKQISEFHQNKKTDMTDKEYDSLCQNTFEQDVDVLLYLPEKMLTQGNFILAVERNGLLLDFINQQKVSSDDYQKIALAAVKQNSMALQFVQPEEYKVQLIEQLSLENILTNNFSAIQYFPKNIDYQPRINEFLSHIEHVVVMENSDRKNREVLDTFDVYSTTKKRANKTLSCDHDSTLNTLLSGLKKPINLVLVGHCNVGNQSLAGFSDEQLAETVKRHPQIGRITLLGCSSVQAKPTKKEKEMMATLSKNKMIATEAGLALLSRTPDEKDINTCVNKISVDREGKKTGKIFILCKLNDLQYQLYDVDVHTLQFKIFDLNAAQVLLFAKILDKPNGFNFPAISKNNPKPPNYLRGGKSEAFISESDVKKIINMIFDETDQLKKEHPSYQKNKSKYPFLASEEIEEKDLLPSFMKRVAEAIHKDTDIKRTIVVKGYPQLIQVDTQEKQMKSSDFLIYKTAYYKVKNPAIFFKDDNINRDELEKIRRDFAEKEISQMKSLTVRIKK